MPLVATWGQPAAAFFGRVRFTGAVYRMDWKDDRAAAHDDGSEPKAKDLR